MTDSLKKNHDIAGGRDYKAAVYTLDKHTISSVENSDPETFELAVSLSKRLGITHERLNELSIIHVAGSKGKGSVCAMCENILRGSGFKTGFLSSPHLVEFRERIRIDGKPLSKEKFAKYFFDLYDRLERNEISAEEGIANGKESSENDKDGIENGVNGIGNVVEGNENGEKLDFVSTFHFLTMMAYHVFIEEKVDVAIIEVGIGGIYDSTNIHRNPTVVGISLLDYDHMSILGKTINSIAGAKAGICKSDRPAFTIEQPEDGLQSLQKTAKARNASCMLLCPSIDSYDFQGQPIHIGLGGDHQRANASLALQLCKTWMEEMDKREIFQGLSYSGKESLTICNDSNPTIPMAQPFVLPESFITGLKTCRWPGRTQIVKRDNVTYYIDGAHTTSSIKACLPWFDKAAKTEAAEINGAIVRVLVFNIRGDRNYTALLEPVLAYHFDEVVFCPSVQSLSNDHNSDAWGYLTDNYDSQVTKCGQIETTFRTLLNRRSSSQPLIDPKVTVASCVKEAFELIAGERETTDHTQVLVTGSLYLVGAAIAILDPELAF